MSTLRVERVRVLVAAPGRPLTMLLCAALVAAFSLGSVPAVADDAPGGDDAADETEEGAPTEEEAEPPAEEAKAGPEAPGMPTFTMPTLDLPRTELPGTEGMQRPEAERREAPERRGQAPNEFRVISVQHARGHRTTRRGCVPRGPVLEGFRLPAFPGEVQPFTTCVRLSSDRTVIARFEANILDPRGREVADASGEVSFAASGTTIDYVVEWVSFHVRTPGTYTLVIRLDRQEVGRFEIEVGSR